MKKILNLIITVILTPTLTTLANTRTNDYTFHNWSDDKIEVTIHSYNGARSCKTTVNPYNGSPQQGVCETNDVHHNIGENCLGKIDIRKVDAQGNKTDWHIGQGVAGCDSQQFTIDGNGLPWPGSVPPAVKGGSAVNDYTFNNYSKYPLAVHVRSLNSSKSCDVTIPGSTGGKQTRQCETTQVSRGNINENCLGTLEISKVDANGNKTPWKTTPVGGCGSQTYTIDANGNATVGDINPAARMHTINFKIRNDYWKSDGVSLVVYGDPAICNDFQEYPLTTPTCQAANDVNSVPLKTATQTLASSHKIDYADLRLHTDFAVLLREQQQGQILFVRQPTWQTVSLLTSCVCSRKQELKVNGKVITTRYNAVCGGEIIHITAGGDIIMGSDSTLVSCTITQ